MDRGVPITRAVAATFQPFRSRWWSRYAISDCRWNSCREARSSKESTALLAGSAEIKVPPGTGSGQKLRIKGKGITDAADRSGDLFAVVQIVAPAPLSARARQLLEELAPELQNPRESGAWT